MSILFFFFGLFIGSFLLVVIDRYPRGESILFGRSHCDMCGHSLAWYDLVPILSYLLLRGKCRYCHKSYGLSYPFVELVTGAIFATIPMFFQFFSLWEYIPIAVILCSCIVVFFCDLSYGIIPDVALIVLLLASVPFIGISFGLLATHLLVGILAGSLFLLLYVLTKGKGMGFGDVKLAFCMGFLLGFPLVILAFYLAFLTGAIVALILILRRKKKFRGDTISFGPFLIIGLYISLIGGMILWNTFFTFLFRL